MRRLALLFLLLVPSAAAGQDFDQAEFAARRARLIERIPDGVAVILGATEHDHPTRFRQSPDFYYLTGLKEPGTVLVLNGVTKNAAVFAVKRPEFGGPSATPRLRDVEDAQQRYGIPVLPMESFFTFLSFHGSNAAVRKVYLQLTPPDAQIHARFEAQIFAAQALDHPVFGQPQPYAVAIERIREAASQLDAADVSPLLDELRWVKTPFEIERLRRSGRMGAEATAEAIRGTRPGMYEYEIAAAAQYTSTRLGADGDAFPPIVPSGPLTPIVHYMENRRQMQAGEIVYMDYGSDWEYYTSDITRTWPVSGRFSAEQEKMYRCVLEARNAIIAAMKPGATLNSLKDAAEQVYQRHGYRDEFLGTGRYIGHFVGISVHDVGGIAGAWLEKPFVRGVVFNVEPILQFPERKIHIRLEDTVVLTDKGPENLTAAVPAEVEPLYALIREPGVNSKSLKRVK
ncbi:MAG TPA: Xaa-Pro peptidase family protein [Gemmatimonadales bacterium]|nr:Xaa-Pro peptidase family protein [Gemmatimonadales bacterium]